jgi:hypothetical protein
VGDSTHPAYSTWFTGGLASIINGIVGFGVVLLGWHWLAQREIAVTRDRVTVRRWLHVVLGRDGERFALDSAMRARFFVKGGAKLAVERPGVSKTFSIWFWSLVDAHALAVRLSQAGASVQWELPHPPDVGQT